MEEKIKKKVMVVDDDRGVLESFEVLFENEYNLIFAENGYQALKLLHSESPSLIFVDILMPGMNGIEILREIRKQGKGSRVILISASENESYKTTGMELGAAGYLKKPFDINEVISITKRVLEGAECQAW